MGQIFFPGQPGKIIVPPSGGAPIINYIGSQISAGSQYSPANYCIGLHHSDYIYTAVTGDTVVELGIYAKRKSAPDRSIDVAVYEYSGGALTNLVNSATIPNITGTLGWFTVAVSWSLTNGTTYAVAFQNPGGENVYVHFTNVDAAKRSDWDNSATFQDPWSRSLTDRARFEVYAKVQR
jgi:hypothetical protein